MSKKRKEKKTNGSSVQRTASEIKKSFNKEEWEKLMFEKAQEALKLLNANSSTTTRTTGTFNKELLRTYMQNPTGQYKNLRNLSRFLYYRSPLYRRLIQYDANMIDLNFRNVVPLVDLVKGPDEKKMIDSYYKTLLMLENMNLPLEFLKAYIIAWREDVFFGCAYHDDTGFFILPLDPDYCKVTGIYPTGDLCFDMDMSYFRSRQEQLELWGEPFQSMYRGYKSDMTNGKWQPMPDENCVCLKVNIDDWEYPIPPYAGLFSRLINLEDLDEIMAVADEQNIYKLLIATIPTIKNSDEVDDWAVDPDTAISYYNKMKGMLPDFVNAVITPIPIESVSFDRDQATDVNKLENSTKSILTTSGGVQTLCPPAGTTAYTAAIRSDEEYAISSLLPQTQAILNRLASYNVSKPAKIILLEVTKYTRDNYIENSQKLLNYGLPLSMTLGALSGFNELELASMAYLQKALNIEELFTPLATASTRSSDNWGRPRNGITDRTDEADASEDKRDNMN